MKQDYDWLRDDQLVQTDAMTEDLRRRSVQAGAAVIAGQLVTNGLNLAATMVLARMLTPSDFGLVAMVLVVLGFAATLRDLGLSTATIQRKDIGIHQVSNLLARQIDCGFGGPAKRMAARCGVTKVTFDRQALGHFRRHAGINRGGCAVIKVNR